MLNRCVMVSLLFATACSLAGQESPYGISVPVTITGNTLYTNAKQTDDGLTKSAAIGFRAVASPAVRFGPHWFAYSVVDLYSATYFTGTSHSYEERAIDFDVRQAFVGYSGKLRGVSFLVKAGQLTSAFGLAPIEYDDSRMPLLRPPGMYTSRVNLRADQIPCGTADLMAQRTGGEIEFHCGGAELDAYGLMPITLYGMPGVEIELSTHRVDARVQVTNSSPANPQGLRSNSQFAQWTAGGGYTLGGGLHIGISGFRGPYLDRVLETALPAGRSIHDFAATGIGTDLQWARGDWSLEGEWQRFRFEVPGFAASPAIYAGYGQAKRILSPHAFAAVRFSGARFGSVVEQTRRTEPKRAPLIGRPQMREERNSLGLAVAGVYGW